MNWQEANSMYSDGYVCSFTMRKRSHGSCKTFLLASHFFTNFQQQSRLEISSYIHMNKWSGSFNWATCILLCYVHNNSSFQKYHVLCAFVTWLILPFNMHLEFIKQLKLFTKNWQKYRDILNVPCLHLLPPYPKSKILIEEPSSIFLGLSSNLISYTKSTAKYFIQKMIYIKQFLVSHAKLIFL